MHFAHNLIYKHESDFNPQSSCWKVDEESDQIGNRAEGVHGTSRTTRKAITLMGSHDRASMGNSPFSLRQTTYAMLSAIFLALYHSEDPRPEADHQCSGYNHYMY